MSRKLEINHGLARRQRYLEFHQACVEEAPLYNKFSETEKQYALFTDVSFCLVGKLLYGVPYDKSQKLLEENKN